MRPPAVAGSFYPLEKKELEGQLEEFFKGAADIQKSNVIAAVCPHAGYVYSGRVAACSYASIKKKPDTVVIIGPNHTGYGPDVSVYPSGEWDTPLGQVKIDDRLADTIARPFYKDETAHEQEHSIEVQLPFLQYLYGNKIKIVPICIMNQDKSKEVGETLAKTLDPKKHLVIASSDMSHYVPNQVAYKQDLLAVNKVIKFDTKGLEKQVSDGLSMCGYGPVEAAMVYAKKNGCTGKLLKYMTSGDATGDISSVVGYASIIFTK